MGENVSRILTSVIGLTSSCRVLVASSMRSGRSGMMGERGVGEMGENVSRIMTS